MCLTLWSRTYAGLMSGAATPDSAATPVPPPSDILETDAAGPAIIRGGVVRAAGFVANVLLSIGSAALLIRYLGATGYGSYTIVVSLTGLVAGLSEAGTTNIGVREYATLPETGRRSMLRNLLGMRLVATSLGLLLATAFAFLAGYEGVVVAGVIVGGAGLLLFAVQANLSVPLLVGLQMGRATAVELLRQVVTVGLTIVLIAGGAGLLALLSVPVPAAIAVLAVTVPLVRGATSPLPAFDLEEWRRLFRVLLPYTLTTAVGVVYSYVAVLLLSVTVSTTETGYFGAAFRVFMILSLIPGTVVTTAFPLLARTAQNDEARLAYALQRLFDMALIGGIALAGATALGAESAVDVIAGEGFAPSVAVLQIQSLALLGTFFAAVWGFALLALDQRRAILTINLVALGLSMTLVLALAPAHGAAGAAWATVAGETLLGGGYVLALVRTRKGLRPSLALVPRILLATGFALAVPLALRLPSLAAAAAFSALLAIGLLVLRCVPDEVLEAIPRRGGTR